MLFTVALLLVIAFISFALREDAHLCFGLPDRCGCHGAGSPTDRLPLAFKVRTHETVGF
jgi:hypothetical protein